MAAEAVLKIKEAEDKGREIVKTANDEAKQILAAARKESAEKKKAALEESLQEKSAMIRASVEKASKTCEEIASQGMAERENILAPENSRLERAIGQVMERIVNANGNR